MSSRTLGLIMLFAPFVLLWLVAGIACYRLGTLRKFMISTGSCILVVLWISTACYLLSSK